MSSEFFIDSEETTAALSALMDASLAVQRAIWEEGHIPGNVAAGVAAAAHNRIAEYLSRSPLPGSMTPRISVAIRALEDANDAFYRVRSGIVSIQPVESHPAVGEASEPEPETESTPAPYFLPPDCDQPWALDQGQHDIWKRQMYLDLFRWKAGLVDPVTLDLQTVGLTKGSCVRQLGALLPLSDDVCSAARRLGFFRLCKSTGLDVTAGVAKSFYNAHRQAALLEAERRLAVNLERKASMPDHQFDPLETTMALFDPGDLTGPSLPEGRVLADLVVLDLN